MNICGQTIKFNMQAAFNYHKCIACVKGWLAEAQEEKRVDWATVMLNKYSEKEDWHNVRFSDEIYFGYRFEGKLRIIRRSGTQYRWDCIQHRGLRKIKNVYIVGPLWVEISNQIFIFMRCRATATEK